MDPCENSPYRAAEVLAYIPACGLGSCLWSCPVRNRLSDSFEKVETYCLLQLRHGIGSWARCYLVVPLLGSGT